MTVHPKEIKNSMKLGIQAAIAGDDPFSIHMFDDAHEAKREILKGSHSQSCWKCLSVGKGSRREVCPQTADIKLMLILSILSFNH